MNMRSIEMLLALLNKMPAAVVFCMAPPVQLPAVVQAPPLPEIVKLPLVLLNEIPFAAPLEETLRNEYVPALAEPPLFTALTVVEVTSLGVTLTPVMLVPAIPFAAPVLI